MNETELRNKVLREIIAGYDQLLEIYTTGGAAALSGHAYDKQEFAREIMLLEQLKRELTGMIV